MCDTVMRGWGWTAVRASCSSSPRLTTSGTSLDLHTKQPPASLTRSRPRSNFLRPSAAVLYSPHYCISSHFPPTGPAALPHCQPHALRVPMRTTPPPYPGSESSRLWPQLSFLCRPAPIQVTSLLFFQPSLPASPTALHPCGIILPVPFLPPCHQAPCHLHLTIYFLYGS